MERDHDVFREAYNEHLTYDEREIIRAALVRYASNASQLSTARRVMAVYDIVTGDPDSTPLKGDLT